MVGLIGAVKSIKNGQWRPRSSATSSLIISSINSFTMKDKNLDYLSKQLQYTGFGEALQPALKEAMQKGETQFMLPHVPNFDKDRARAPGSVVRWQFVLSGWNLSNPFCASALRP
jgi:hypothetical protein